MKNTVKIHIICLICAFLCSVMLIPEAKAAVKQLVKLPSPDTTGGKPLMETLKLRRSSRGFAATKLPIDTLSSLLWSAQGVNRPESGLLTAPTARNLKVILTQPVVYPE